MAEMESLYRIAIQVLSAPFRIRGHLNQMCEYAIYIIRIMERTNVQSHLVDHFIFMTHTCWVVIIWYTIKYQFIHIGRLTRYLLEEEVMIVHCWILSEMLNDTITNDIWLLCSHTAFNRRKFPNEGMVLGDCYSQSESQFYVYNDKF